MNIGHEYLPAGFTGELQLLGIKEPSGNNLNISHLIFRAFLLDLQSQNPQRSATTLAVLFNQIEQT